MSDIEVGNHVICIDGKFRPDIIALYDALPVENQQYVVRDVLLGQTPMPKSEGTARILLVGMRNPEVRPGVERGFDARRFRKPEEIKSSEQIEDEIKQPFKPMSPVFA